MAAATAQPRKMSTVVVQEPVPSPTTTRKHHDVDFEVANGGTSQDENDMYRLGRTAQLKVSSRNRTPDSEGYMLKL